MYSFSRRLLIALILTIIVNMVYKKDAEVQHFSHEVNASILDISKVNQKIVGTELASLQSKITLNEVIKQLH